MPTMPSTHRSTMQARPIAVRGGKESYSQLYGRAWKAARLEWLGAHPLCVMCEARGHVTAATVVDHKVPHHGDLGLFWDRSNWQSLCEPDHNSVKARIERAAERAEG